MDCKTARLLLAFARPQTGEMEEADAEELDHHLGQCPECAEAARLERRLDQHVGKAMRQVEVPSGTRSAILVRLANERSKARRRWIQQASKFTAAAAALLLVLGGVWYWHVTHPPALDLATVWDRANHVYSSPPTAAKVEEDFRKLGYGVLAPVDLNYDALTTYGLADLQGQLVPQLVFIRSNGPSDHAFVYLVNDRQFDLRSLNDERGLEPSGRYSVTVRYGPQGRQAQVIVHTAGDLSWLISKPDQAL